MDKPHDIRQKIDDVNSRLLRIINMRASLINDIIKIKGENGLYYYNPSIEDEMLRGIIRKNKGPLPDELIKEIFSSIFKSTLCYMGIDRERQLLVSSSSNIKFKSIHDMFNIPCGEAIIIAGPCSVESAELLDEIAQIMKKHNITCIPDLNVTRSVVQFPLSYKVRFAA